MNIINQFDYLRRISRDIRLRVLELTYKVGKSGAHTGGSLSLVEILVYLYNTKLKFDIKNPLNIERDRFILSKGHSAIALFAILESVGFLTKEEVDQFEVNGSPYYAHASRNLAKGIEFSGGSLSLGLSFAVGVALSCKKDNRKNHIYVLIGDGECDEGLVWEALMSASHFNLNNLTVIVDFNKLQSDGYTNEIMNKITLGEKFKSFGFNVQEIDGHNFEAIDEAFRLREVSKPNAIIAHTVKGKGVSFMENNINWHHGSLSLEQYEIAKTEQG